MQERSDWDVLLDNRRFTVSVPEPLNMTDTEIVDFIVESCKSVEWLGHASTHFPHGWRVILDDGNHFCGTSLDKAIGKAAAYHKEVNE